MRVDVAGRNGRDAEVAGELAQSCEAGDVAALVRPLELDEEPVAAERLRKTRGAVRIAHGEPVPRAGESVRQ